MRERAEPIEVDPETTGTLELLRRGGPVAILLLLPGALLCALCPLWVPAVGPLAAFALAGRGEVRLPEALALLRQRGPHAAIAFLVLGFVPLVWVGMVGQAVEAGHLGRDLTFLVGAAVSLPLVGLLGAALAALPAQALLGPDADLVRAWRLGEGRRLEGALTFLLPACLVGVAFPLDLPWATAVPRGLRMVGFVSATLLAQFLLGLLCARYQAGGLRPPHADDEGGEPSGGPAAPRPRPLAFALPPETRLLVGVEPAPPGSVTAQSDEAAALLAAGKVDAARARLAELVGTEPASAAAWANLARANRLLGRVDEAASALARARALAPERADLWCEVGRLALARGELGEALRAFARAAARPQGEPGQAEGAACRARIEAELDHEGTATSPPDAT